MEEAASSDHDSRYRRHLIGFCKTTPNIQIVGFSNDNSYQDVLSRAANGLGLKYDPTLLRLLCSGGVIPDAPIGINPWSLGEFIKQNGGNQNRSKKSWEVEVPFGHEEMKTSTSDSVS